MPYSHTHTSGLPIYTTNKRLDADTRKTNRSHNFTTTIRHDPTTKYEIIHGNTKKIGDTWRFRRDPGEVYDSEQRAWRAAFGTTQYGKKWWPLPANCPERMEKHLEEIKKQEEHLARLKELAALQKEKDRLEAVIAAEKPNLRTLLQRVESLPLSDRITEPIPPNTPLPRINKYKHSKRHAEVTTLLAGVARNMDKLRTGLLDAGYMLPDIFDIFDTFRKGAMLTVVRKMTHSQWRHLRRDCRTIAQVAQIKDWNQVRVELQALTKQKVFMYKE